MNTTQLMARLLAAATLSAAAVMSAQAADPKPATPTATAAALDDAAVTEKIKAALAEHKQVEVNTTQGVVVLSGPVASSDDASRVIEMASTVAGVKQVKSELTVAAK